MSTETQVALISTGGFVLVALVGVLVEMVRTRRRADVAAEQLTPNHGTSLRDVVDRIDRRQVVAAERGERTEGKVDRLAQRLDDHLTVAEVESRIVARIIAHLGLPPE